MPVSFYTPTTAGTVPKANMATSLLPALGQGLLQAAQMYQNVKAVDKAATEASALFKDPVYANIFRQVGLSAVRNGESPAPVIQNMLSTAIKLKSDEEQMAQRERMMRFQFGQATALENLRTKNNLMQQDDQQKFQTDYNSPTAVSGREQARTAGQLMGGALFRQSPIGQADAEAKAKAEEQARADAIEKSSAIARETTRSRIQVQREEGVLPEQGSAGTDSLFDSGVDMDTPLSELEYADLESLEMDAITYSESSPQAKSQIQARLRAIQQEKNLRLDRDKVKQRDRSKGTSTSPSVGSNTPNVSPAANRYITP